MIITGASSGIGRATAVVLGRPGTTLILAARRADQLESVRHEVERNGGSAVVVPTDVAVLEDLEKVVADAVATGGELVALINVAGVGGAHSVLTEDAGATAMIDVNLVAPIRMMRMVVPIMLRQGHGSIVNIGSVAGEIGVQGIYSATKFGLRGITDSARRELAGSGIGVTLIEPGYVRTEMTSSHRGSMPGPEVVAEAVASALTRPRRRVIVPRRYQAVVFFATRLPWVTDRLFARRASRSHSGSG